MTVYLDAVWLLNFGIDTLLLLLTGLILKRSIVKWKLFVGALFGSTIILFYFSPFASIIANPITKLFYSVLMVFITFGYKRFRIFLQSLFTFYFSAFMIGGGLLGLHFFFQSQTSWVNGIIVTTNSGLGNPISWWFLLLGFPVLWYFSRSQIEEIEAKKIHFDQLVKVEIKIEHIQLSMIGLIDSGNQLYDPISKKPVMILDISKFSSQFPEGFANQVKHVEQLNVGESNPLSHRLKIVPYRGVGQEHQFLVALRPDQVTVEMKNETVLIKNVLVGLNHQSLSAEGEYDCILHPRMFTGAKVSTAS